MAPSSDEWSVNANEALQVSLVQPGLDQLTSVYDFHPKFTYPIFGEAEQIFGYKGLQIGLQFAAHDLRPNVDISYDKKFTQVGSTSALNLNKTLKEFLPAVAFQGGGDFKLAVQSDTRAKDWQPPGNFIESYSREGHTFEIWGGSLLDPRVRSLVANIQIFILFYIEGGQYINLEDVDWTLDRWRVYFIYQKSRNSPSETGSPYSFVGYATTYRFYRFSAPKPKPEISSITTFPSPDVITPNKLSSRLRISQFLILPPHQSAGHGSALYRAIYSAVMADPTITEMTVEDPSEEFDKLRDINDFKVLRPQFEAANISINTSPFSSLERGRVKRIPTATLLPINTLQKIRSTNKIASRQFARQVEMFLLAQIPFTHRAVGGASLTSLKVKGMRAPNPDDRSYFWWRLLLKQRIMKKNKDLLQQLPLEDRAPQIEDSARGQEDEYEGLILAFALRKEKEDKNGSNGNAEVGDASSSRKRKIIVDEDDDEDDDTDATTDSKKMKIST